MIRYTLGLDLGQPHEFTGLAVVESTGSVSERMHAIRHLQRFPPGTAYDAISGSIGLLLATTPLPGCSVIADVTAVGTKLVPLLRAGVRPAALVAAVVTNGQSAIEIDRVWQIPKRDLVTGLQILLQGQRLKVARGLVNADILVRELATFRSRPTQPTEALDWRNGSHDDLVLAVALACWWSERGGSWSGVTSGGSEFLDELDRIFPHLAESQRW